MLKEFGRKFQILSNILCPKGKKMRPISSNSSAFYLLLSLIFSKLQMGIFSIVVIMF